MKTSRQVGIIIVMFVLLLAIITSAAATPLDTIALIFGYPKCTTGGDCKSTQICYNNYCLNKNDGNKGSYCGDKPGKCYVGNYCDYETKVCLGIETSKIVVKTDVNQKKLILTWVNKKEPGDKISAIQLFTTKQGKEKQSFATLVMNRYNEIPLDKNNILCGDKICGDATVTIKYGTFIQVLDKKITLDLQNCYDYDTTNSAAANNVISCTKTVATDGTENAYCLEGYSCKPGLGCSSGFCAVFAPEPSATCSDGVKNQGETGVDCGGPCKACASCSDGIKNQDEQGIDCGGSLCPNKCASCSDGIKNQDETGVDCGGKKCKACPSCNDGIKNQDEVGVDCGGSCPKQCIAATIALKCAKKVQQPDPTKIMDYAVCQEEKDCAFASFYCKDEKTNSCGTGCNTDNDCKLNQKCDLTTKQCVTAAVKPTAEFSYNTQLNMIGNVKLTATASYTGFSTGSYSWLGNYPTNTNYVVNAKKVAEFTVSRKDFPAFVSLTLNQGQKIDKTLTVNVKCTTKDYCKQGYSCSVVSGQCEKIPTIESCTTAEDCSLYGYYCALSTKAQKTCKQGCDSNSDCSPGEVCDTKSFQCLSANSCARVDDCKAGQYCNLKTNKCEATANLAKCKTENDCPTAGTYCKATDQPAGSKFKGVCDFGCNEGRDCKYYQSCIIDKTTSIGACTDTVFTAEFTANITETVGNEVVVRFAPKENQFKEADYSWKLGSTTDVKTRNFWWYAAKDKFPETVTLALNLGGKTKTVSKEVNIKCTSAAYCKSGYACNLKTQQCEKVPATQKCENTQVLGCVSNDMCVQKNMTTGQLECYNYDQVITIEEINKTGSKEKKKVQCSNLNTWCPEGFFYSPKTNTCALSQKACYVIGDPNTCGPDTQLTFGWFNDQACFSKDGNNDQACCVKQSINGVDYYEYSYISVY